MWLGENYEDTRAATQQTRVLWQNTTGPSCSYRGIPRIGLISWTRHDIVWTTQTTAPWQKQDWTDLAVNHDRPGSGRGSLAGFRITVEQLANDGGPCPPGRLLAPDELVVELHGVGTQRIPAAPLEGRAPLTVCEGRVTVTPVTEHAPVVGISSLWFTDPDHGFAGTPTGIFATADGGRTWAKRLDGYDIVSVQFVDPSRGWALGEDRLWVTVDGGDTWITLPREFEDSSDRLTSVQFLDLRKGWGRTSNGWIASTADSGQHWTRRGMPPVAGNLCFLDDHRGFVAGDDTIAMTTDGGHAWSSVRPLTVNDDGFGPAEIACGGDHVWVLFSGGGAMSQQFYTLLHSGDAGGHWDVVARQRPVLVEPPPLDEPSAPAYAAYVGPIALVAPDRAHLVGECPACDAPAVTLTAAGPEGLVWTWPVPPLADSRWDLRVFFLDKHHGWMTGRPYEGRPRLASTDDSGRTWFAVAVPVPWGAGSLSAPAAGTRRSSG
jgi:photosystem II stability/assembly factor-like uncharacterized protein